MNASTFKNSLTTTARIGRVVFSAQLLTGFIAGLLWLSLWQQYVTLVGTSLPATTGFLLAVGLGWHLGNGSRTKIGWWHTWGWLAMAALWVAALPLFGAKLLTPFSAIPMSRWQSDAFAVVMLACVACLMLAVPVYCLAVAFRQRSLRAGGSAWPFGVGVCLSWWTTAVWSWQTGGLSLYLWLAVAFTVLATAVEFWLSRYRKTNPETTIAASPQAADETPPLSREQRWLLFVALAFVGAALVVNSRIVGELLTASAMTHWLIWTAAAAGFTLGASNFQLTFLRRFFTRDPIPANRKHSLAVTNCCLLAAVASVGVAALFPQVVRLMLKWSAFESRLLQLQLLQLLFLLLCFAPLGVCWGRLAREFSAAEPQDNDAADDVQNSAPRPSSLSVVPVLVGALAIMWGGGILERLSPGNSVVLAARLIGSGLLLVAAGFAWLRWRRAVGETRDSADDVLSVWQQRVTQVSRMSAAVLAVAVMLGVWAAGQFNPAMSSRLLFTSTVTRARSANVDDNLLPFLDEGRLAALHVDDRESLTFWKLRGVQLQIRKNGLPAGMVSVDPGLCPQFSAEVMHAAMPLCLHEDVNRVLILGVDSGVPLTTTLAFPVQQVTCIERSAPLVNLLADEVWSKSVVNPLTDARVNWIHADASLALLGRDTQYDVVLSTPEPPATVDGAIDYSEEFYNRVWRQLNDNGIFCQRLPTIDHGPEFCRTALATMAAVFKDVALLETASGQTLLLGSRSEGGLKRPGLHKRLQRPHVRAVLADIGWDWSVPLNLQACDGAAVAQLAQRNRGPAVVANGWNGQVLLSAGPEMLRWGYKAIEHQQMFAPFSSRYAEWDDVPTDDRELLRRLAETTGQRRLMTGRPDEYWLYRKAVKDQITKDPLTTIVQVKGEGPKPKLHPQEKRRMAYFDQLDLALKTLDPADIEKVADYARPYDPMLSYFVHEEIAELFSRTEPRAVRLELRHRLHAAHFAAMGDKSVRNVAAAMELLARHPDCVETPQERWDHLNALLQSMKLRWAARFGYTPTSPAVTLNDISKSLAAVEVALSTMDDLAPEVGISRSDWRGRKRFAQSTIIAPLQSYQSKLLPFHQKEKMRQQRQKAAR